MKKKLTPRNLGLIAAAVALVVLIIVGAVCVKNGPTENANTIRTEYKEGELLTGTHYVEIEVKDYGTMTAELYADIAPITVTNFMKLVDKGFYNNLTFHRIITGFMIQGGDPLGNGRGGSDEQILGEFSANNVENELRHERGVLSMARSNAFNSASSQFFIMHADNSFLDGQYAAFGRVLTGMEVVDAICADARPYDSNGMMKPEEQPVITAIRKIEKPQ